MTDKELVSDDRRKLMKAAAAGAGAAALFGGFGFNPLVAQALAKEAGRSEKPLKAAFSNAGCADCHLLKDYVTPAHPANGVPGNFSFRPRTDFLLHDIGTGDGIGNDGDSVATTRLMRTAPLWGLHLRTKFLHDGRAGDPSRV